MMCFAFKGENFRGLASRGLFHQKKASRSLSFTMRSFLFAREESPGPDRWVETDPGHHGNRGYNARMNSTRSFFS